MKIFLIIIFTFYYTCASAQLRIGLQGGYNSAHLSPRNSSSMIYPNLPSSLIYNYGTKSLRGFQAGAVAEVMLAHNWFLCPGLLVDGKGTRLKRIGFNDTSTRFIELHYIEVPISLVHQWKAGKRLLAFGGGGLYAARAFRGVEKGEGTSLSGSYYIYNSVEFNSHNKENDGQPTIINPMDYGFTIIAGVERQGIQLLITYEHGLQRVFPKSLIFQEKYTNRVLSLSAVYFLKAKSK